MKTKILNLFLITIIFTLCIFSASCKKSKDLVKDFVETVNNVDSYKLSGTLESCYPSGTKQTKISVYYQKPDFYRVELVSPNSIDKQIILKNKEGVYVLLPSLNKNFKISSDWPLTSSYPYLLQSLSKDILADQELQIVKEDKTTTINLKAKLFDEEQKITQKIVFDNETRLPVDVSIYKDNDTLISRFIVDSIETNNKLDNNLFVIDTTMQTLKSLYDDNKPEYDRSLTYPTYCPSGLVLKDEVISGTAENKRVMLTYASSSMDGFITIVEKYVAEYEQLKTEYIESVAYVMGGSVALVSGNSVRFYEEGIEYLISSNSTDKLELIYVADSLRTKDEK